VEALSSTWKVVLEIELLEIASLKVMEMLSLVEMFVALSDGE